MADKLTDGLIAPAELGVKRPEEMRDHLTDLVAKINMIPAEKMGFGESLQMGLGYSMLYEMVNKLEGDV